MVKAQFFKQNAHKPQLRLGNYKMIKIHSQTLNLVPLSDAVAKVEREQHFQQEQVDETARVCLFTKSRV